MTSPFANSAAGYREQGLAVMPCGPGTKFPGRFTAADGWRTAHDWQKYCDRLPTAYEMDVWDRWPDAGVCLALGSGSAPRGKVLVAVDIDTDEPTQVAAIKSVLPGSPVAKRGAKGETQFYLANPCVINTAFNDGNKRRLLDLLAHGRQTVLPPTIHPDCQHCGAKGAVSGGDAACSECGGIGQPYRWTTPDTLEFFNVADLPMLPDDIAERIGKALEPFGYVEPPKLAPAGNADLQGEKVHRTLNDAALANLDAWVPGLGLTKLRKVGPAYKAVAVWRPSSSGRPESKRAANLTIRYDGIKDCGDNKGYTPLDLVMAACEADLEVAFRWLQERVAPSTPMLITSNPTPSPEPVEPARASLPSCEPDEPAIRRTSPKGNLMGLRMVTSDGERVADPLPAVVVAPALPALADTPPVIPPGLLGDIVRWMDASTDRPSTQLNLGAAIAFLGAIAGRHYEHPSQEARTNFLCVGVAPTGFGKNHPLKAIERLAHFSNTPHKLGPEEVKSESALRKVLEAEPSVCCLWDELGRFMNKVNSPKASTHERGLSGLILKLFSKASDTYRGAEAAAEKAIHIINPNLCIFGVSTPEDLWSNVTSSAAADGFLPRWLVFDAGKKRVARRKPTASLKVSPEAIRRGVHGIMEAANKGNLGNAAGVKTKTAEYGPGAEAYLDDLIERMEAEVDDARDERDHNTEIVLSRFVEHAVKLSLIYAVGCNPAAPVITVDSLAWAEGVVRTSTNALVRALKGNVADSEYQAQHQKVVKILTNAMPYGITEKELLRTLNGSIEPRFRFAIMKDLEDSGVVFKDIGSGPKGGKKCQRYFVRTKFEDEAEVA